MTKAQKLAILVGELDTELKARSTKELIADVAKGALPHNRKALTINGIACLAAQGVVLATGTGLLGAVLTHVGGQLIASGVHSWGNTSDEWKVLASRALGGVESKK